MNRTFCVIILATFLYLLPVAHIHTVTAYTLPYPSYMPGHTLYTPRILWDQVMEWWHFGSISKTKYHLALSDRYLVEAVTLLEYKQYLLAVSALSHSNTHFISSVLYARDVVDEQKDKGLQATILKEAGKEHTRVLTVQAETFVENITWSAEHEDPVTLELPFLLRQSLIIRSYANTI